MFLRPRTDLSKSYPSLSHQYAKLLSIDPHCYLIDSLITVVHDRPHVVISRNHLAAALQSNVKHSSGAVCSKSNTSSGVLIKHEFHSNQTNDETQNKVNGIYSLFVPVRSSHEAAEVRHHNGVLHLAVVESHRALFIPLLKHQVLLVPPVEAPQRRQ